MHFFTTILVSVVIFEMASPLVHIGGGLGGIGLGLGGGAGGGLGGGAGGGLGGGAGGAAGAGAGGGAGAGAGLSLGGGSGLHLGGGGGLHLGGGGGGHLGGSSGGHLGGGSGGHLGGGIGGAFDEALDGAGEIIDGAGKGVKGIIDAKVQFDKDLIHGVEGIISGGHHEKHNENHEGHHEEHNERHHGGHRESHGGKFEGRGIRKNSGIGSSGGISTPMRDLFGLASGICRISYVGEDLIETLGEFQLLWQEEVKRFDRGIADYVTDKIILKGIDLVRKTHVAAFDFLIDSHIVFDRFVINSIISMYRMTKAPLRELLACQGH